MKRDFGTGMKCAFTPASLIFLFAALPALAACSGGKEADDAAKDNHYAPADAPPTAKERPVVLEPLVNADYRDRLDEGMSCSFTSSDGRNLFAASATDDSAVKGKALLKVNGDFRTLRTDRIGGYALLREGASFSSGGMTASIERASGDGAREGVGSTAWPATLHVAIEDGRDVTYDGGRWSCGV